MKNLDEMLGETPELGCMVGPPGQMKTELVTGSARSLLGAAGRSVAERATEGTREGSPFAGTKHRFGYLAVTREQIAVVATKPAMIGHQAVEVIARADRDVLTSIELGSGTTGLPLVVRFADGAAWLLEVPRPKAKAARQLVAALAPTTPGAPSA